MPRFLLLTPAWCTWLNRVHLLFSAFGLNFSSYHLHKYSPAFLTHFYNQRILLLLFEKKRNTSNWQNTAYLATCSIASGHSPEPSPRARIHKKKSQMRLEQSFFYYVIILSELHKVVASTLEVILKKPPNGCRQQGQNPFVKKHRRCCLWNLFQTTLMWLLLWFQS